MHQHPDFDPNDWPDEADRERLKRLIPQVPLYSVDQRNTCIFINPSDMLQYYLSRYDIRDIRGYPEPTLPPRNQPPSHPYQGIQYADNIGLTVQMNPILNTLPRPLNAAGVRFELQCDVEVCDCPFKYARLVGLARDAETEEVKLVLQPYAVHTPSLGPDYHGVRCLAVKDSFIVASASNLVCEIFITGDDTVAKAHKESHFLCRWRWFQSRYPDRSEYCSYKWSPPKTAPHFEHEAPITTGIILWSDDLRFTTTGRLSFNSQVRSEGVGALLSGGRRGNHGTKPALECLFVSSW